MLGVGIGVAESEYFLEMPENQLPNETVILTMRTIVIWRRSREITFLLPILLICFWIPLLWFLNEALSSLVFAPPPRPGLPGCFLESQKNILFVCFILILGFETGMLPRAIIDLIGLSLELSHFGSHS